MSINYQALNNELRDLSWLNGADLFQNTEAGFSILFFDIDGNNTGLYKDYSFLPSAAFLVIVNAVTQYLQKGLVVFQEINLFSARHQTTIHTVTPKTILSENLVDFV